MTLFSRPDGLIPRRLLLERLGVAHSTLANWKKRGLITPALTLGKTTYYRMPTESELAAIHAANAAAAKEAQRRGGYTTTSKRDNEDTLLRARKALAANPECRTIGQRKARAATAPEGLLSTKQLAAQSGVSEPTLARWRKVGWIVPAKQCERFHTLFWEPLSPESVAELRARGRAAQVERGKRAAQGKSRQDWEPARKAALDAKREAQRPSGALTYEEAAERAGASLNTIKGAVRTHKLAVVTTASHLWVTTSELERWMDTRRAKAPRGKKSNPVELPSFAAEVQTFAPPPKARETPPPQSAGGSGLCGLDYDEAVAQGKSTPAYQGVLGFNLLRHSGAEVYRPAPVNEKPEYPWRYHQRYYKDGWGRWSVRTMNSGSGEVHL